MTIKVTETSEATHREIKIPCPNCKHELSKWVEMSTKEGDIQCSLCGLGIHWEDN